LTSLTYLLLLLARRIGGASFLLFTITN